MKNVFNILLLNIHSMANAGDAVLNEVAVQQLKAKFPGSTITLVMNDPLSHTDETTQVVASFMYWLKYFLAQSKWQGWFRNFLMICHSCFFILDYRWGQKNGIVRPLWLPLLESYQKADFVVSCPGNFLYSSGKIGIPFLVTIFSLLYAVWLGKPLYMMPQTIGPLERGWERRLTRIILRHMRRIVVRDMVSAELLEQLGFARADYDLVPDVAFGFAAAPAEHGLALLEEYQINLAYGPTLGVTLINWAAQNHRFTRQNVYEEAVASAIENFIQNTNGQAVLFSQVHGPLCSDDDRIPAERVFTRLSHLHSKLTFIHRPVAAAQLKSAYGLMDIFLGSRLHSTIFALSEMIPVVAIQYQYKTRGVFRMLDLETWVADINQITPEELVSLLQQAWLERQTLKQHLQTMMPAIVQQTNATVHFIVQDWAYIHE